MTIRITNGDGDGTTELITVIDPGSGAIHKYTDVDGDCLAVFTSDINGTPGVNVRTDHDGCSIPLADIPDLIEGIANAVMEAGHAAGVDCGWPTCGPCSLSRTALHANGGDR